MSGLFEFIRDCWKVRRNLTFVLVAQQITLLYLLITSSSSTYITVEFFIIFASAVGIHGILESVNAERQNRENTESL